MWERDGPFTDAAKTMEAQIHTTVQTNGQISDLSVQHHGRVIRSLQEQPVNHEEMKGYLTRNIRTRFLRKELGNLMNNQDYSRKINDNSEDKILSIINGFKKNTRLHILQDPTNSEL